MRSSQIHSLPAPRPASTIPGSLYARFGSYSFCSQLLLVCYVAVIIAASRAPCQGWIGDSVELDLLEQVYYTHSSASDPVATAARFCCLLRLPSVKGDLLCEKWFRACLSPWTE